MNLRTAISAILTAFLIFGSGSSMALIDPTKELVPLDLSKAGETASIKIHVSRFRDWATRETPEGIALQIIPPRVSYDSELGKKYSTLFKSLTGQSLLYKGDVPSSAHAGISVRVTWTDVSGKILRQREVYSDNGSSKIRITGGASFGLDAMSLPPGDYVVTVETIKDDPRFDNSFLVGICAGYIVK
jgi:hypothetical protein